MRNFKNKERSRGDIVARADDAFGSQNYAEYIVDVKKEGKYKAQRILMIALYIMVGVVFLGIAFAASFPWIVLLVPVVDTFLYHATWHYFSRSFFYSVDSSYFTVLKVYGYKKEDDFVKMRVSDAEMIAPLNEEYAPYAHAHADAIKYEAVSSFDASDIYFMTYQNEDGKHCVIFFEATEQILKALKYYNSKAIVMTKTLH